MKKTLRTLTLGMVLTFMFTTIGFAQSKATIFEAFTGTAEADTEWTVWPVNNWTYDESHLRMENPESMQTNSNAYLDNLIDASDYDNLELQFSYTIADQDFSMQYGLNVVLQVYGKADETVYQQIIDQDFYDVYYYDGSYYTTETIDISDIAGGKNFRIEFLFGGTTGDIDYWEITDLKVVSEAEAFYLGLTAQPETGGTVEGAGNYEAGAVATVTATPNEGYSFINWMNGTGNEVSTEASFDYTMPAEDAALIAMFQSDSTSIANVTKEQIRIFPNPATNHCNIKSDVTIERVMVLDNLGKTVYNGNINAKEANIQTQELQTGVYFLRVFTAEGDFAKKLLIE